MGAMGFHKSHGVLPAVIMREKNMIMRKHLLFALVLFTSLLFSSALSSSFAGQKRSEARVTAVNDGDTVTLRMNDREYRTRLIGLDAPEMGQEPWGGKAREHLRKLLKDSRWRVSVETDITQYDKYDRLLVYIWSLDDELLNERMILDGYAVLFTIQPNSRYVDRFRKAQRRARKKKKGIWGPDGLQETPLAYKKKHPRM
jgi:micrococcal nuclease